MCLTFYICKNNCILSRLYKCHKHPQMYVTVDLDGCFNSYYNWFQPHVCGVNGVSGVPVMDTVILVVRNVHEFALLLVLLPVQVPVKRHETANVKMSSMLKVIFINLFSILLKH